MNNYQLNTNSRSALREIIETSFRNIPQDLLPVQLNDQIIGYVTHTIFVAIQNFLDQEEQNINFIHCANQKIIIDAATPNLLSIELRILAQYLREIHLLTGWRDEEFSYIDEHAHERFRVERTFFRAFGFHSRAIHINGYTHNQQLWLARRSNTKHIDPNLLDNITAGGIGANETLLNSAYRELREEAGIVFELAQQLNPISSITVHRGLTDSSLHHETLYTYDLELPITFQPQNQDQEVSDFILVDYEEALKYVLNEELTIDAGVVTADFLLRHC
jgi:8-oxo-dGTP pyrophosphatase MutT (NUDIX family)